MMKRDWGNNVLPTNKYQEGISYHSHIVEAKLEIWLTAAKSTVCYKYYLADVEGFKNMTVVIPGSWRTN
jgi:hypothetical protein